MYQKINNKKAFSSRTLTPKAIQRRRLSAPLFPWVDNRPEAVSQAKWQEMADRFTTMNPLAMPYPQVESPSLFSSVSIGPVQRKIAGIEDMEGELPNLLFDDALAYNALATTSSSEQINTLSKLEHAIYTWFIEHKSPDMTEVSQATAVGKLMNAVKAERLKLVTFAVQARGFEKQTSPPVAGFKNLPREVKEKIRVLWDDLIFDRGKIKITESESKTEKVHTNFKFQVLTEFSRLLEGEFGRNLIQQISDSDKQVMIEPFSIRDSSRSFAAHPDEESMEVSKLTKLKNPPAEEEQIHYPQIDITEQDELHRRSLLNLLQSQQPDQKGIALLDGGTVTYYRFGTGSNARITMPSDLPDSSLYTNSRLADSEGNELATPVFITLGHELGHVLHMQRGGLLKEAEIPGFFESKDEQEPYLSDREEYVNIEENENALRREHGLGVRKGHINIPYLQQEKMTKAINKWYAWIDKLGEFKKLSPYSQLEKDILNLYTRVYNEWDQPDKFISIKADFETFQKRIEHLQFKFLHIHFSAFLKNEKEGLLRDLYRIPFRRWEGQLGIVLMDMAINSEVEYEKVQAAKAIENEELGNYVATLSKQRKDYIEFKLKTNFKEFRKRIEENPDEHEQKAWGLLVEKLQSFENVDWLLLE